MQLDRLYVVSILMQSAAPTSVMKRFQSLVTPVSYLLVIRRPFMGKMIENTGKRGKVGTKLNMVYADVGDKRNYAGCYPKEDGSLVVMGWIIKYCAKDTDTIVKTTMADITLGKPGLLQ
jgi:hypothetical protein